MEKEFIPFELAVKLKDLGFDEMCLGYYSNRDKYLFYNIIKDITPEGFTKAPLWQQTFSWFREKHSLNSHIRESLSLDNILEFVSQINGSYVDHNHQDKPINRFETYEEARQACLEKLIEIVENNKQ